jgi:hypothetical protein
MWSEERREAFERQRTHVIEEARRQAFSELEEIEDFEFVETESYLYDSGNDSRPYRLTREGDIYQGHYKGKTLTVVAEPEDYLNDTTRVYFLPFVNRRPVDADYRNGEMKPRLSKKTCGSYDYPIKARTLRDAYEYARKASRGIRSRKEEV